MRRSEVSAKPAYQQSRPLLNAGLAALALAGLGLFLAACRGTRQPAATTPTAQLISEQAAIDAAIRIAMNSRPEVSGSQVLPREIQARQLTLAGALQIISGHDGSVPAGYQPDMPVWAVTMDGWWTDVFPRPTDSPTPQPYRHLTVILDAVTGLEIEGSLQP